MGGVLATLLFWKKIKNKPQSAKENLLIVLYVVLMLIAAFTLFIIGS